MALAGEWSVNLPHMESLSKGAAREVPEQNLVLLAMLREYHQ
jgi:hypothetical protein